MLKLASYKLAGLLIAAASAAFAQGPSPSVVKQIGGTFDGVHKQILDMAKDFPADKYDFKLKPEMRSFGDVIVHVSSGLVYAAKKGRGENVKWDEFDPKNYKGKEAIVALLEKSISDADATFKAVPEANFARSVQPWLAVLEHAGEHYGLLVAYYRANGIVPPESRPKK